MPFYHEEEHDDGQEEEDDDDDEDDENAVQEADIGFWWYGRWWQGWEQTFRDGGDGLALCAGVDHAWDAPCNWYRQQHW